MTGLLLAPLAVIATTAPAHAAPITIQILATNDFHGRLINEDGTGGTTNGVTAGAAILSGAVKQLRAANPNTVFAAAGDLIGASTFESFIQHDKPTLLALNEAGLEVSAAGNHEFDAGYNDLVNRVMKPESASNPEGGANWQYLAANVRKKSDNSYALPDVAASPGTSDGATWYKDFGSVRVGFVGAVTEDLPSLVSPAGIADIKVSSIVSEVNAGAAALRTAGADVVVMLVHEGSATTNCSGVSDDSAFGRIVKGVGTNVNAIVSGHTHLAYNCSFGDVPVVSAGQYGLALNQLQFTVDDTTGVISGVTSDIKYLKAQTTPFAPNYPADPAVTPIVNDAIAKSNVLGAVELGKLAGPFSRARLADGTTENRGGESTLGNLVAEVQRWATQTPEAGGAQIAFMNPGGLRQDMVGNPGGFPATLTYKQAAVVQPFANTLVNMKMTGAQIKTVLEQQWQTNPGGPTPSRPFLRLGTSKGFFATYDATRPEGNRVTGMSLNGKAIENATSYSVTVNSFLAAGGDNFRGFTSGHGQARHGQGRPAGDGRLHGCSGQDDPAGRRPAAALRRRQVARRRPTVLPHRRQGGPVPRLARDDRLGRPQGRRAQHQGGRRLPASGRGRQHRRRDAVRPERSQRGVGPSQGQGQDRQAADDVHRGDHRQHVLVADRGPQGQGGPQGAHQARAHRQG